MKRILRDIWVSVKAITVFALLCMTVVAWEMSNDPRKAEHMHEFEK